MKAVKKYPHGGKTDPPKDKKHKKKTAKVMGLTGQRVYSDFVESPRHVYPKGHPRAGHPRVHGPGDTFAPAHNIHTKTGLYRRGHGQVSRPEPIKRGKKGGKGSRPAKGKK